jgi:pilus assembly protein CpaC
MHERHSLTRLLNYVALFILFAARVSSTWANPPGSVEIPINSTSERVELTVNSSKILKLPNPIPRTLVNNPDVVRVVPLSPDQLQISALKPGVTQVNLFDKEGTIYTVDVMVFADARELEMLLKTQFPTASVRVRPTQSGVILSGFVDRSDDVSGIVAMSEDYYPRVINNIRVGGVQQVMLKVKVMEVSRTKLRVLAMDWANFGNSDTFVQSVSGLIANATPGGVVTTGAETFSAALIEPNNSFFAFLEAAREQNLVKILAEPTLVAESGRVATFQSGGEFPVVVPQGLGTVAIEYKEFGTRVDFVPFVVGNGVIKLQVRPQISEVDNARAVTIEGTRVPGLRTRWVDTAVEMRTGQTFALAGLIQERVEAQNRGLPWLADLPLAGIPFRRVREERNEIELLVMVTPHLVDALDPHEVPPCGPGQTTTSPTDIDLYIRGYVEVPRCCPDGTCSNCLQRGLAHPHEGLAPSGSLPAADSATPPPAPVDPNPGTSFDSSTPNWQSSDKSASPQNRSAAAGWGRTRPENSTSGLVGDTGYDVIK